MKMVVTAHGNVDDFCSENGLTIGGRYDGPIGEYDGACRVLVTDEEFPSKNDFYRAKCFMLHRKVELISIYWQDDEMDSFVVHLNEHRKNRNGGRTRFGFRRVAGEIVPDEEMLPVIRRILELYDAGCTLQQIREDENVRYPDGRLIAVSVIHGVVKDRGVYDGKEKEKQ